MDMKDVYQALGWPANIIALGEDRQTAHRVKRLIESAVAAEREACAKMCYERASLYVKMRGDCEVGTIQSSELEGECLRIAGEIRKRSNAPAKPPAEGGSDSARS